MFEENPDRRPRNWLVVGVLWLAAIGVLMWFPYKWLKGAEKSTSSDCMARVAMAQRGTPPLQIVDDYAACAVEAQAAKGGSKAPPVEPARCKFAGTWTSTRGNSSNEVVLQSNGKFTTEPVGNSATGARNYSGAWNVAGDAMVWAYDNGPVWPPDINPLTVKSDNEFTLREVNGETTTFVLFERGVIEGCAKR